MGALSALAAADASSRADQLAADKLQNHAMSFFSLYLVCTTILAQDPDPCLDSLAEVVEVSDSTI